MSIGAVLIGVGASRWLGLSPLISTLALGATVANASPQGDRLLRALGRADPPLCRVLRAGGRGARSLLGPWTWSDRYRLYRRTNRRQDCGRENRVARTGRARRRPAADRVLPRVFVVARRRADHSDPDGVPRHAATITGIVLAAVVIFEVIGPLRTRRALFATGEAKTIPSPLVKADSEVSV